MTRLAPARLDQEAQLAADRRARKAVEAVTLARRLTPAGFSMTVGRGATAPRCLSR
jgi:hypothetical protein